MNTGERDNLLIRLDERTKQNLELTEKQEIHLDKLNTSVQKHAVDIAVLKDRKVSKKAIGGSVAASIGIIIALIKAFFNPG